MAAPREAKRDEAIVALLAAASFAGAAKLCGVDERTLRAWMAQPDFLARYHAARNEAFGLAMGRLVANFGKRLDVLEGLSDAGRSEMVKFLASSKLMDQAVSAWQVDQLVKRNEQLEARIADLEAKQAARPAIDVT